MKYIFIAALIFGFTPLSLQAALLYIEAPTTIKKGEEVLMRVKIDTERAKINAVSGAIAVPMGTVASRIYDGSSALVIWIERPSLVDGILSFSGFTPGGFDGDRDIFTFVLSSDRPGKASIGFTESLVLQNDGNGTAIAAKTPRTVITISPVESLAVVRLEDTTPPESFFPVISTSPEIFSGGYFVSFDASDKLSGIKGYEYQQAFLFPLKKGWASAESPIQLGWFDLFKKTYIKAIDRAGNETIASVSGPYRNAALWVILIALLLCALPLAKRSSPSSRS